jgi:nucleoside-diphosphate-sugar epimerase
VIDVAAILRRHLGKKARKAPTRRMPDLLVNVLSLFNPEVRGIKSELGKIRNVDASHAKERLGWVMRPVEETLVDCAESLIAHGIVKV